MKAPPFRYLRPLNLAEACTALAGDEDAQILAGGQSLMATLNMRLAHPSVLVDINRVEGFPGIEETEDGGFKVGALVRHAEVATSQIVRQRAPLISAAMPHVAHIAVRNRGTHCGSLALADPAAEMPACAIALDAGLVLVSTAGRRTIPAGDYFLGPYETPRRSDEILLEVIYPPPPDGSCFGFGEIAVRHGDFPLVGVAIAAQVDGVIGKLRLVTFACEASPRLSTRAAEIAQGREPSDDLSREVAEAVATDIEPMDSPEARRVQTRGLVRKVMSELLA